jgi:hypothetical protein
MIATDGNLKHLFNKCLTIQNPKSKIQNGITIAELLERIYMPSSDQVSNQLHLNK